MQRRLTAIWVAIGLALFLSLSAKVTLGQAVTGSLLGTVVDSTGAAIPNASVTLTNEGTNAENKTTTGPQGYYTFPDLSVGTYSVTVTAKGFKTFISKGNTVLVEQSTTVNATLQPGAVNEQVTVNGASPLVETTTSDLGTTISQTQIQNLPVNGRIPAMLMQLAPGSTPAGWGAGNGEDSSTASTTAPGGDGGGAYTDTNGFPFAGNLYLVDGVTDVELENGYMGLQIPFDFISEMRLVTSDPTAEYGTFGAQVSNITTKSGTNKFHGQVYEYNRNTDFDASDYFSKVNPPFHYNQFGGEADGPILKNRLFFAADLQWLKLATGTSGRTSLPTAAARSGDLSGFDSNGAGPITNAMACEYSANANFAGTARAGTGVPCTASAAVTVPGTYDTVPAADIVPIAGATSGYLQPSVWPLPNLSGAINNASYVQLNDASEPQEDARVDWVLSQNDRLFFRFGYSNRSLKQPLLLGADPSPAIFMNDGNINATNQLSNNVVGWDHLFGSNGSMINELRLGYSRYATSDFTTAYGIAENNALGVPNGNIATYNDTSGVAAVNISGGWMGTGDPGWVPNGLGRLSNIYQINDAFSIVKGRNNWKFGISINPIQARVFNSQNDPRGQLGAQGDYTGAGTSGSALADWLVGAMGNGDCQGDAVCRDHFFAPPNTRTTEIGEFAQDNLRLTPKVTLNLGVRYDIYTHPVDTKNLQSNFVTSGPDAGLIQLASSSNRGPNVNTYYGNLAPRVGFAYTPDNGKTAIRAALGVSYFNFTFGADGGTLERNFPLLEQENNASPQSNCNAAVTPTPAAGAATGLLDSACGSLILANGLPGNSTSGSPVYQPLVPYSVAPGGTIASPAGFGVYQVAKNFRPGEADNWNVSIERQLGANMAIHAAYVGTKGAYLYNDWQLNQCNPTGFTQGPTYAQLQAQYNTIPASSINASNYSTQPYPGTPYCYPFYSIAPGISTMDFRSSGAKSHYNAGELVFDRRAGANLTFTAAYTWSKLMDNYTNQLDSYDQKQYLDTVGFSHANFPQTLTLTYVYALPFGKGQRFANSTSTAEDALVGGWTISGVTWFRSGSPLLVTAGSQYMLSQGSTPRANYTCSIADNPHTVTEWIQTSCWSQPVGFVFGNAGVGEGQAYGPRYQSWDMSLGKTVHLTEDMRLQFQAQFFNIFNHTNFQPPNTAENAGPPPSGNFGEITSDFLPRQGQLGMVLTF